MKRERAQVTPIRKVAEAIFEEIQEEKEIREIGELDDLEGYDLAFLGFPVQNFGPSEKAKKFLEKHCMGKKVALFITHAAHEDSEFLL